MAGIAHHADPETIDTRAIASRPLRAPPGRSTPRHDPRDLRIERVEARPGNIERVEARPGNHQNAARASQVAGQHERDLRVPVEGGDGGDHAGGHGHAQVAVRDDDAGHRGVEGVRDTSGWHESAAAAPSPVTAQ